MTRKEASPNRVIYSCMARSCRLYLLHKSLLWYWLLGIFHWDIYGLKPNHYTLVTMEMNLLEESLPLRQHLFW